MDTIFKELTYEERATWGECPICQAKHGEWCDGMRGIAVGRTVDGGVPENGVHLGRLNKAPFKE